MIQLENINDEKPVFLNKPYDFNLYENTEPNRSGVGEIFVSDKDGDDVTVRILGDQDGKSNFLLYSAQIHQNHISS